MKKNDKIILFNRVKRAIILISIIMLCGIFAFMIYENVRGSFTRGCIKNLYRLDSVKRQLVTRLEVETGAEVNSNDPELIKRFNEYLRSNKNYRCSLGGTYEIGPIGEYPTCSYEASWWALTSYKKHSIYEWEKWKR